MCVLDTEGAILAMQTREAEAQYINSIALDTKGIMIILGMTPEQLLFKLYLRFLYKGIIINQNKKLSQPTLKRRFFKKKAAFFSWPGLGKEWC